MINSNFKIDVRYGIEYPETGEIEWKSEFDQNLINNGGLDMLADYWATQCTENIYLESGGAENARSTGAITISQTGTLVQSSAAFFNSDDATYNRLIVFADGSQATVTSFIDSSNVGVAVSSTVLSQIGSIYYVEETLMQGFVKASTTYKIGSGLNENSWSVAADELTITNKRTVEFPVEASDVTYSAAGWTPLAGDNQAVFGRKVFDIEVLTGTKPIIQVIMTRVIDVAEDALASIPVTGLTAAGASMNMMGSADYNTAPWWSSINSGTGASVAPTTTSTFLECKQGENLKIALGEYPGALTLGNIDITGDTYSAKSVSAPAYVAGNYYLDFTASFTNSDFSSAVWKTIAILNDDDDTEAFWRFLFTSDQNFVNKLITDLTIRKSWKRSY